MNKIDFIYNYPYAGYGDEGRFQATWSEKRKTLNGCYTYPMVFNNTVTRCRHIKVRTEIENTGSGTIFNRKWDFMVQKSSGTWVDIETFTMPETGIYTVDCDIGELDINMIAFVPSSNPGSGKTWNQWCEIEQLTVTESLEVRSLASGTFQYGVFPNRSGVKQSLTEVYVNIDGTLVQSTDILVNIGGTLKSIAPVYSGYNSSDTDVPILYSFTPSSSGTYRIRAKDICGDHELRLYDSDFTAISSTYFYAESFELTAGALYYITVTHYPYATYASESYLQIYKEA